MTSTDAPNAALRLPLLDGKVVHPASYRTRRFWNWFPLGLAYALLYMGRYNLTVAQGALGSLLDKAAFGEVFGTGTVIYGFAFVLNGPLSDRIGGKRAMLISVIGASLANAAIGWYLRDALLAKQATAESVRWTLTCLYGVNMYFQSFGAVAIVKVNSSWFHVRERGVFSGIFGVMISAGIYFAYEGNRFFLKYVQEGGAPGASAPVWVVFFTPAIALMLIALLEGFLLKDHPWQAGMQAIETGEAPLTPEEERAGMGRVLVKILTNPIIMTVAFIELCTGVLRQGVMQWYYIYAGEHVKALGTAATGSGWAFAQNNWGLIQFTAGVLGGNAAGWVSDAFFQSRRAPAAGLLYAVLLICSIAMCFTLESSWALCALGFFYILAVIGIHGLLSGTATMDFGGRKGTATAVGVIDGFVYLGTGIQAFSLGYITSEERSGLGWRYWPIFLIPFAVVGLVLLIRIWHAVPKGRKASY